MNLSPIQFQTLWENLGSESERRKVLIWRCASDIRLFAAHFFPHYCKSAFNLFHDDTFTDYEYLERGIHRASAAPRGYAKSTIKAFLKPIHDLCYKLERFVVIISNTEAQAKGKLKDIRSELLSNQRLIDIYGEMLPTKKVGETDYIAINRGHKVRFLALGSKTEIRGIRFGAARPSKVVCDDVEHSTEVDNEEIRTKMQDWHNDVISKIGNKETNIEYIGTVLHRDSLLANILKNPKYESRRYKAIISWADRKDLWEKWKGIYCDLEVDDRKADAERYYINNKAAMLQGTEVLWPEHESYYELQEEIIESGYRSFMKEKQDNPLSDEDKIFDPEEFGYFVEEVEGLRIVKSGVLIPYNKMYPFGVIDPATGQTKPKKGKKPDFTCILSGYQDMKGRLLVVHDATNRKAPTKYIKDTFELYEKFSYEKFGVETNLYRNLLLPNMVDERKRREKEKKKIIKLPFYDIEQVENKHKRIYTLEPKVSHGWILFNKTLSQEFFNQMIDFPKGDHDDCPDALEMLWSLTNNRYKPCALSMDAMAI